MVVNPPLSASSISCDSWHPLYTRSIVDSLKCLIIHSADFDNSFLLIRKLDIDLHFCYIVFNLLQSSDTVSGPSLYEMITSTASCSRHEVVAIELQKTASGALGFMLGVDALNRPIVKHVEPSVAIKKGDR